MRLLNAAPFAVLGAAALASPADAAGFYGRIENGAVVAGEVSAGGASADLDPSYAAAIALGRGVFPWLRAEGEALYVDAQAEDSGGQGELYAGFANVSAGLPTNSRVVPFVGFGVGYGQIEFNDAAAANDSGFVWQAKAGVSLQGDHVGVELAYRYVRGDDFETDGPSAVSFEYEAQIVTLGVGFAF